MDCSNPQSLFDSFANTCRVCLSLQDDLVPISEIYFSHLNKNGSLEGVNIVDVFKKYCNVQMHDEDYKPSKLCRPCIGLVYRAFSIFEKFLESDELLDSLVGQYKPQELVVDSEIEETLADFNQDHLNSKDPLEESLIESEGDEKSAGSPEELTGSPGHEDVTEYEQGTMMLKDYENEKNNSEVSDMQDKFFDLCKTLSTQSEGDSPEAKAAYSLGEKQCANSAVDSKESVQNSLKNHNSCEDDKAEFIIIIPDNEKSKLGESKSFIKMVDKNVDNSNDKKCVDTKCKAQVWDHTYSREGDQNLKNITNKRTRKKLIPVPNKPVRVRPSRRVSYPVQKFTEFKCNACENAQFDDVAKLIEHIKEIHPTLKKCVMCPRVLSHPEYMITHVASHSEFGRFTCRKCLLVFKSEEAFQNHKGSTKHKTPFSCNLCGKLFTLRTTWRVHNEVIHKKGARHFFQCWVCGLVLKWARNYKGHLRSHKIYPRDKSHLCEYCAKGFYTNSSLTKHIMAIHKKEGKTENIPRTRSDAGNTIEYKCDYCPKTLTSAAGYFAHRISHPECDDIKCRYCEEVFTSLKGYKEHKVIEHSSFICDICKKGFPNKERLAAHVSLHKGDFKCRFCDASFQTSQRRKIHEYVHTNERPHQCKICGSRFKQRTHLSRHIECLHTEKRFVCNQCGRRCQFESTYKNHLRSHTGVKPFLCPYCLKDFRDTIIRHRHVKRDHPEMFEDFLLYKKQHQGEEVKRVEESQSDTFNYVFVKEEEETMFSALLSEDEVNTLE